MSLLLSAILFYINSWMIYNIVTMALNKNYNSDILCTDVNLCDFIFGEFYYMCM